VERSLIKELTRTSMEISKIGHHFAYEQSLPVQLVEHGEMLLQHLLLILFGPGERGILHAEQTFIYLLNEFVYKIWKVTR
jgi:hypothetical protein